MATADHRRSQERTGPPANEELAAAARREPVQSSRSRLLPCAAVISILREKHWSFAAITAWLGLHGVQVAESTVQRFHRSQERRDAARGSGPPPTKADPFVTPQPQTTHENHDHQASRRRARSADRPKYNTDF